MKEESKEKFGALQKLVYDYVAKAVEENDYTIELDGYVFRADGYVSGCIKIGGVELRMSVNEKKFICWHCGDAFEGIVKEIPGIESKIYERAVELMKEKGEQYKQTRIRELEDEIERLKSA